MKIYRYLVSTVVLQVLLAGCQSSGENLQSPTQPIPVAIARDQAIYLEWPSVANAAQYNLYWATDRESLATNPNKVENITSPYLHEGLINGTPYFYAMTSVIATGESPRSKLVSAIPLPPPNAPSEIFLTPGDSAVSIDSSAVAHAEYYNIYYTTDQQNLINKSNANQLEHITFHEFPVFVDGLVNGQVYYFSVSAVSSSGEGPLSQIVPVIPSSTLAVASGANHTCAVRTGNSLWCWGVSVHFELSITHKYPYSLQSYPLTVANLAIY